MHFRVAGRKETAGTPPLQEPNIVDRHLKGHEENMTLRHQLLRIFMTYTNTKTFQYKLPEACISEHITYQMCVTEERKRQKAKIGDKKYL